MSGEKRNFILHGGILAMAGIIVRIIGMIYRIPLVNIIGGEGNGIYSVAYNIYNIMLVLSSYGLPMAVSKLISARYARNQFANAASVLKASIVVSLCSGTLASLLLYLGADAIEAFYGSITGLAIPLRVLAPTIFFVAVLGVLRGFFQGQGTMIPTAFSQLVEQLVHAVVSIVAAYMLMKSFASDVKVAAYGAAGATLGTTVGAFVALLIFVVLFILYLPTFRRLIAKDKNSEELVRADVYKEIMLTVIPIIIGQTLYNVSAVIDDAMYSNMMAGVLSPDVIKENLGNFASSFVLLISIPQGVASAMSASMLPSIVRSYTANNLSEVRGKLNRAIQTNMMIAVPSFVGLVVLGQPVIRLLFSRYDHVQGANMLKLGAAAVIFYTLATVTSSALQGISRMMVPVKHSFIALVIHIVAVYAMLSYTDLGIYSIIIGNASFPVLIFILNLIALRKFTGFRLELMNTFVAPIISATVMGAVVALLYVVMLKLAGSNLVAVAVAVAAAVVVYFGLLFLLKKGFGKLSNRR